MISYGDIVNKALGPKVKTIINGMIVVIQFSYTIA